MKEEALSHIFLLSHKHVILMGTYFVEPEHEKIYDLTQEGTLLKKFKAQDRTFLHEWG